MKIDEREIERLSTELNSKQYTGLFYGPGNNIADLKSCLLKHLNDYETISPKQNPFPVRLSNFIDGHPQSDKFTLCQFTIDYDITGGLYVTAMSAYQQMTKDGHLSQANEELKTMKGIPTKQEVLLLTYKGIESPISLNHVDEFVNRMKEKGFDGLFFGIDQNPVDLTTLLNKVLDAHGRYNQPNLPLAFWIGTITEGKLGDKNAKNCLMKVRFDYYEGLKVDHIKYSQRQHNDNKISLEKEQKIPSMLQLPTKAQINASLVTSFRKIKSKRRGI